MEKNFEIGPETTNYALILKCKNLHVSNGHTDVHVLSIELFCTSQGT